MSLRQTPSVENLGDYAFDIIERAQRGELSQAYADANGEHPGATDNQLAAAAIVEMCREEFLKPIGEDENSIYVYAEHATLAGRVVAWDPNVKTEEDLVEEKGDDILEYAESEEAAIARARNTLDQSTHEHRTARLVLEHLGFEWETA